MTLTDIPHKINEMIETPDGTKIRVRTLTENDMDEIKRLYYVVYGGNYTLEEVNNTDKMKWAIHDPNYEFEHVLCNEHKCQVLRNFSFFNR